MISVGEVIEGIKNKESNDVTKLELREDEYIKGDNIYCNKCNTPRTSHIEMFGSKRVVRCICQCEIDAMEQEKKEKELRAKITRIENLQRNSLMGIKYKNTKFDNTIISHNESFSQAYNRCKKYCENANEVIENGFGMYMYGNAGTGKTHLTSCMANDLISQYKEVMFTNFYSISKEIRGTYGSIGSDTEGKILERIKNVDVLFLDDLGTESLAKNDGKNFMQDLMFQIINARYNNNKSTIFTSNYSLQELITDRGIEPKIVDRIRELSHAVIKIEGNSFRGEVNKRKNIPF